MTHPSLENLKCPDCAGPMVPRTNKQNGAKFWGCKNFPRCKGTRDSMGLSRYDRQALEGQGEQPDHQSDETTWKRRYD